MKKPMFIMEGFNGLSESEPFITAWQGLHLDGGFYRPDAAVLLPAPA